MSQRSAPVATGARSLSTKSIAGARSASRRLFPAGDLDAFLDLLSGVERQPSGIMALCPAHKDSDPSLSVGQGDDGRILIHCFGGCESEDVMAVLGGSMADLAPPSKNGRHRVAEPETVYDYRDEQGKLIRQKLRKPGKEFLQRAPDGKGGWVYKLAGVRDLLYRLPELLQSPAGAVVFICEGEKDADNVQRLGLVATTNIEGAAKENQRPKWKSEYTTWLREHLPDRRFVLLPDNDAAGRAHMAHIQESLKEAGLAVVTVALSGLPDKGDVSDWVKAGGTREQLLALVAAANAEPSSSSPDHFGVLDRLVMTGSELETRTFPEPEQLVPHILLRGFSTLLAGDSKIGKTALVLRMVAAAAVGGWWLDRDREPANRLSPCRILFLNFEDPPFVTQSRLRRMMAPDPIPENLLIMEPPYGHSLNEILAWLPHAQKKFGLDAVILDPIAIAAEWKDENDNALIALTFKHLQQVAAQTQLALLSCHHVTKKPGEWGTNIRGGSSIKANVMGWHVLEREKERFRLHGINKLTGTWHVLLNRSEDSYEWWIEETRTGQFRTATEEKADQKHALVQLVLDQPGITFEQAAERLGFSDRTIRRYVDEMPSVLVIDDLPKIDSVRGRPERGIFPNPGTDRRLFGDDDEFRDNEV